MKFYKNKNNYKNIKEIIHLFLDPVVLDSLIRIKFNKFKLILIQPGPGSYHIDKPKKKRRPRTINIKNQESSTLQKS